MKKISPCCGKIDCVYNEYCKCRLFTQSSAKPNIELDDLGRCDRYIQKYDLGKSINIQDYSNEYQYCPVCSKHTEFKNVDYDNNEYLDVSTSKRYVEAASVGLKHLEEDVVIITGFENNTFTDKLLKDDYQEVAQPTIVNHKNLPNNGILYKADGIMRETNF